MTHGSIAKGSDGAGLARRIYRRSPIRYFHKIIWNHRGLRPADVVLASYPRSGSVWLRFILSEMLTGEASFRAIRTTVPEIYRLPIARSVLPEGGRIVKSHEPYLARYRRAIHLVRDPRDVCISYFYFLQRIDKIRLQPGDDEAASFERHIDAFLDGRVDAYGNWQSHLLSWWQADADGLCDILRVAYEDLRADPSAQIMRIAEWIDRPIDEARARTIAEQCSFERMKRAEDDARQNDPAVFGKVALRTGLPVVREGRAGSWRERLTDDQRARFAVFARGLALMGYEAAAPLRPATAGAGMRG